MKYTSVARLSIALIGSMALVVATAEAKPKGKGGPPGHAQKGKKDKGKPFKAGKGPGADLPGGKKFKTETIVRFRDDERGRIVDYFSGYRKNDRGLPPGLAKNLRRGKPLPPGWQQKVVPGYRIDDVWWQSFSPVPYSSFPQMRAAPDTRLYLYGDRLVRVYEPRREVLDVVRIPTIRY